MLWTEAVKKNGSACRTTETELLMLVSVHRAEALRSMHVKDKKGDPYFEIIDKTECDKFFDWEPLE